MTPDTLFRGDRIDSDRCRRVPLQWYSHEGLISRLVEDGDPEYITKHGLVEAVRAHSSPGCCNEQHFLDTSSFLSFTSDHDRALHYASNGRSECLVPCKEDYTETNYVFVLDVSSRTQTDEAGVYVLEYDCDYSLARPSSLSPFEIIAASSAGCELCKDGKKKHTLLLIDVVRYLSEHKGAAKPDFATALENAGRDSEWLVLPTDYLPWPVDGFSARIALSHIWRAEHFYLSEEGPRDPTSGGIQGRILDPEHPERF